MRPPLSISACVLLFLVITTAVTATPAGFIENRGQLDDRVLFYAPGESVSLFLTRDALVFDLRELTDRTDCLETQTCPGFQMGETAVVRSETFRGCALYITLCEDSSPMRVEAGGELPGYTNFFTGGDPARWCTGVRSFAEVIYHDILRGLDISFRFEDGELAYKVSGLSAAEQRGLRFECRGADRIFDVNQHTRRFESEAGDICQLLSTDGAGTGRLQVLPAGADQEQDPTGAGDRDDPDVMLWSTFLGGSYQDWGYGIAIDSDDRVFVAGYTFSSNFPTTPGSYDGTLSGSQDAVVARLSPDGDSLEWSTYLGGSSNEIGFAIALDAQGNPVVAGTTNSTNFPTTAGSFDQSHNGSNDLFVTKLTAEGDALIWSSYYGGSENEDVRDIVVDRLDRPAVVGWTNSTNIPTTSGAYDRSANGSTDAFVARLDADGSSLDLGTYLGGSGMEHGWRLRVDAADDIVIGGRTASTNFPVTAGAYDQTYSGGDMDIFVSKLSGSGTSLLWSTFFGGDAFDWCYCLDLDSEGNPVFAGGTRSSNFPTTAGAYDQTFTGYDAYVSKLSANGSSLLWSTFLGGEYGDEGYALIVDPTDHPIVTGLTASSDFPTTADAYDQSHNGSSDVFVSRLSSGGDDLVWSSFIGGSNQERGWDLALDSHGNPAVVGHAESSNFPSTPNAYDPTHNGNWDVVAFKLDVLNLMSVSGEPARLFGGLTLSGPNPSTSGVRLSLTLDRPGFADVRVLDVSGRSVATLYRDWADKGKQELVWSGRNEQGNPVLSGIYFIQLRSGRQSDRQRVVLIR